MIWLKQIREQLLAVWIRSNNPTRVAFVAVAVGCLLLISAVGIWSSRPQYVPLAVELTPEQTGEIVNKLDAAKIDHKMNYSGSTILVPSSDFNRARPLVSSIVTHVNQPPTEMESTPWDVPRDRDRKERERSEQQIAQSIMRLKAIKYASVKIGDTTPNVFVRDRKPKTASVLLEIHPDFSFNRRNANAVAKIVAGGVPDLDVENVSIIDQEGRILSQDGADGNGDADSYIDAVRREEGAIYSKLNFILRKKLGDGASAITVTAELDPQVRIVDVTSFDSETGAKTHEKIDTTKTSGSRSEGLRSVGTAANVVDVAAVPDGGPYSHSKEVIEADFEPGKKHETITMLAGKVTRLSIAATVDLRAAKETTKEDIEALIKRASGFDEQRGDKLTLLVGQIAQVAAAAEEPEAGPPWWDGYERLARSLSLGVAAVVALVIGLLIIRKLRPVTVVQSSDDTNQRREQLLNELSSKARENPEAVSRILATWLNDPGRNASAAAEDGTVPLQQPRRRAA